VDEPGDNGACRVDDVWINKNFQIACPNLLRWHSKVSRNSLVAGNGDRTGGDSGNAGGIGKPVLRADFRPRRPVDQRRSAEQSAGQQRETGRGPSISCMEGPRHICARFSGTNPLTVNPNQPSANNTLNIQLYVAAKLHTDGALSPTPANTPGSPPPRRGLRPRPPRHGLRPPAVIPAPHLSSPTSIPLHPSREPRHFVRHPVGVAPYVPQHVRCRTEGVDGGVHGHPPCGRGVAGWHRVRDRPRRSRSLAVSHRLLGRVAPAPWLRRTGS
jgi:hypothetical protein